MGLEINQEGLGQMVPEAVRIATNDPDTFQAVVDEIAAFGGKAIAKKDKSYCN